MEEKELSEDLKEYYYKIDHEQIVSEYRQEIAELREQLKDYQQENRQLTENFTKYKKKITPIKMLQRLNVLEEENQQLRIQISVREENYNKLEDNWNKLKEYIQEICCYDEVGLRIIDPSYLEDKIAELESGVSDVKN